MPAPKDLKPAFDAARAPKLTVLKVGILKIVAQSEVTGNELRQLLCEKGSRQTNHAFWSIVRSLEAEGLLKDSHRSPGKDFPLKISNLGKEALTAVQKFLAPEPLLKNSHFEP